MAQTELAHSWERPRNEGGMFQPSQQTADKAQHILARYEAGEMVASIANDLGISHQAAYSALLRYCGDEWRDSQAARALAEYERAKASLEQCKSSRDPIALACAREQVRTGQWELERLLTRLYGQRTHVTVEQVGDLGDRLRRALERDVSPISVSPHAQVIDSTSTRES
jgi:hypothetical protein